MGFLSRWTRPAWEKERERGDRAWQRGDAAGARMSWSKAVDDAPDEVAAELRPRIAEASSRLASANLEQARRYRTGGQHEAAAEHYRLVIEFDGDGELADEARAAIEDMHRHEHRAEVERQAMASLQQSAPIDDVQTFDLLLAAYDEDIVEAYHALGERFREAFLAMSDGDLDAAVIELRAVADDTDDAVAWYELGRCLAGMGRAEEALEALLAAEDKRPGWTEPRLEAARVCWALRRFDTCEEVLQRAVDDDEDNVQVYFAVATTAALTRQPEYGLEALEVADELGPGDASVEVLRARLHELSGRETGAAQVYEQVLRRTWSWDPETGELSFHTEAALLAMLSYLRRGEKLDRAEELARHLLSVMPAESAWRVELDLAAILRARGDEATAASMLERLAATVPDEPLVALRVAGAAGDEARRTELEAELSPIDRERWADLCADRGW